MCGIYCSNLSALVEEGEGERLLSMRGPNHLSKIQIDDFFISHSLLSITGKITPQPLIKNSVVCLYNGEIYNDQDYGDYDSDGKAIIDAYIKHGETFPKYLDGEFALILYDPNKRILIISTDTFRTKPIYYSLEGKNFGCSSYKTPLEEAGHKNIQSLPPNTIKIVYLSDSKTIDHSVTDFDLEQKNNSFDNWIKAFEESIRKRTKNCREKIFIGLSSGYDSGAIYNELIRQNTTFKAYSVRGNEDNKTIDERKKIVESNNCYHQDLFKNDKDYTDSHNYIVKNTEPYNYSIYSDVGDYNENIRLVDDSGSNWLSLVCSHARQDGYKVCLSGGGADEIISDYGIEGHRIFGHSNFGGKFPDDLKSVFPWASFFGSSMESYMMKEEYVGGAYGVETRYPFLDKKVVQEFLNLDKTLKNTHYKSAIYEYLTRNDVPFVHCAKTGF